MGSRAADGTLHMAARDLPPGWYRLAGRDTWQPVTDAQARAEFAADTAYDLVYVPAWDQDVPLW